MTAIVDGSLGITNATWTTAGRPASPVAGQMGYNTTTGFPEWYDGTTWWQFNQGKNYTATYLIIAGGGGGGGGTASAGYGGGGAAGGYITNTTTLTSGITYSFTVGAGGSGQISGGAQATNGNDSVAFSNTAVGGGYGGTNIVGRYSGNNGGSGGGAGINLGSPGSGTSGQGNAGGTATTTTSITTGAGGGGGGAGAVGANATNNGGNGGVGLANSITGSSVFYAGGGGGSCRNTGGVAGTGGNGGGAAGVAGVGNGNNGSVNTGGGAGAGFTNNGGNGGSGVVIISILTSAYTGSVTGAPIVTTSGANTIIKFTASGSYTA